MTALVPILAALLAGAYVEVPKTSVKSVQFMSQALGVSRPKNGATSIIHGPLRINMSFADPLARKPLLRIVCLCEVGGELVWMDGLWDRPGTNTRLSRSDVSAAFKAAGRDGVCSEASCISSVMPEAGAQAYAAATYGERDNSRGFFRIDRAPAGIKLLLYRFEIWQNGVLAEAWESSRAGLGSYEIPRDWFVRGRYQGRFRYLKSN